MGTKVSQIAIMQCFFPLFYVFHPTKSSKQSSLSFNSFSLSFLYPSCPTSLLQYLLNSNMPLSPFLGARIAKMSNTFYLPSRSSQSASKFQNPPKLLPYQLKFQAFPRLSWAHLPGTAAALWSSLSHPRLNYLCPVCVPFFSFSLQTKGRFLKC